MSQVSGQAGPSEMEDGEMREDDGGRLDGGDERSGYASPAHNTAGGGPTVPQDKSRQRPWNRPCSSVTQS